MPKIATKIRMTENVISKKIMFCVLTFWCRRLGWGQGVMNSISDWQSLSGVTSIEIMFLVFEHKISCDYYLDFF